MHRAVTELSDRLQGIGQVEGAAAEPVKELAHGVDQLVRQMRAEQKVVREWVDEQAHRQAEVAQLLRDLAHIMARREA